MRLVFKLTSSVRDQPILVRRSLLWKSESELVLNSFGQWENVIMKTLKEIQKDQYKIRRI